jgi:solute carrier family 25 protein 39/40
MKSISSMVRAEGPLSLWKGLSATLWRDVPFSGVYWALYETTKGMFERNGYTGAGVAFVCGATSGTTAAVITSPFDVIKTRRQALLLPSPDLVDGSSASSIASSARRAADTRTFSLAMQIMRMEGYKALYAGLTPRIAKIAPACGIMIASYEGLGAFLAQSSRSLS